MEMKRSRKTVVKRSVGRPSADSSYEVDKAILEAASSVFLEKGFEAATMTEIAKRASSSKHTLYTRYPSKEALYAGLMKSRVQELLSAVSPFFADGGKPGDVLRRFGRTLVDTYVNSDYQRLLRMMIAEVELFPDLALSLFEMGPDRGRKILRTYLYEQAQKGILTVANVEVAAEQLLGSLSGGLMIRSTLGLPPLLKNDADIEQWVEIAVSNFLKAYGRR